MLSQTANTIVTVAVLFLYGVLTAIDRPYDAALDAIVDLASLFVAIFAMSLSEVIDRLGISSGTEGGTPPVLVYSLWANVFFGAILVINSLWPLALILWEAHQFAAAVFVHSTRLRKISFLRSAFENPWKKEDPEEGRGAEEAKTEVKIPPPTP